MISEVAISLACALSTISLRALLNVADRSIFTRANSDFIKSMTMNAVFPLFIGLLVAYWYGGLEEGLLHWIMLPGTFFSALAAQITAYSFSWSFKKMPVKNVVVTCKLGDLFLPFTIWAISGSVFNVEKYLFSIATILAFTPILWDIVKTKKEFYARLALLLIFIVMIQPSVNEKLQLRMVVDSVPTFLSFMCGLYFWRTIFVLMPLFGRWAVDNKEGEVTEKRKTYYHLLFARSTIAYVSSTLFFIAIIHGSPILTWPILSAGPLISTFAAYLFLNERMGRPEFLSLCLFLGVVGIYLATNAVF